MVIVTKFGTFFVWSIEMFLRTWKLSQDINWHLGIQCVCSIRLDLHNLFQKLTLIIFLGFITCQNWLILLNFVRNSYIHVLKEFFSIPKSIFFTSSICSLVGVRAREELYCVPRSKRLFSCLSFHQPPRINCYLEKRKSNIYETYCYVEKK